MFRRLALLVTVTLCFVGVSAKASPEDAEIHYKTAMQHMETGDFSQAGASFWAAYQADPSPPLLWNAARAYHKGGELARARELYQKFLEVEKQSEQRWKKALELSKDVTRALEKQADLKAKSEKENREALEREMTDKITKITKQVLSQIKTKSDKDEPVSALHQAGEKQDWTTEGWITFGAGTAMALGSVTLMLLANDARNQVQSPPVDANGIVRVHTQTEAAELQKEADSLNVGALVTGLVGGGAIITGLVLALVANGDSSIGVAPTQGGASFAFGGSF